MKIKDAFPTALKAFHSFNSVPFIKCAWRMALAAVSILLIGFVSNWLTIPNAVEKTREVIRPTQGDIEWLSESDVSFKDYHFIGCANRKQGENLRPGDRLFGPVPCYEILGSSEQTTPVAYAFSGSNCIPFIVRIYCGYAYKHFEGRGAFTYACLFGYAICVDVRYENIHYHS